MTPQVTPGPLGDVTIGAGGGEPLLVDAADGLVDDGVPGCGRPRSWARPCPRPLRVGGTPGGCPGRRPGRSSQQVPDLGHGQVAQGHQARRGAHTTSMALTALAAVAITPATLWSTPSRPRWVLISTPGSP
jgi:hypothetical protein